MRETLAQSRRGRARMFSDRTNADVLRDILTDPDPPLSALAAEFAERLELLEVAVEVQDVLANNPWLRAATPSARPST